MAPPDSAVCNAERQLILGEYKPAPPQSRPLRKRKINPRRAGPNSRLPPRSLTQRHTGRLRGGEGRRGGKREGSSKKYIIEDGRDYLYKISFKPHLFSLTCHFLLLGPFFSRELKRFQFLLFFLSSHSQNSNSPPDPKLSPELTFMVFKWLG